MYPYDNFRSLDRKISFALQLKINLSTFVWPLTPPWIDYYSVKAEASWHFSYEGQSGSDHTDMAHQN
jgi:hypothetical protein